MQSDTGLEGGSVFFVHISVHHPGQRIRRDSDWNSSCSRGCACPGRIRMADGRKMHETRVVRVHNNPWNPRKARWLPVTTTSVPIPERKWILKLRSPDDEVSKHALLQHAFEL